MRRGIAVAALAAWATFVTAQPPLDKVFSKDTVFSEANVPYDGSFTFLRLRYTPNYTNFGRGGGYFGGVNYWWDHDYPRADQHFMKIMEELTAVDANTVGHNILSVSDPEIFKYPLAIVVEPGHLTLTDAEAANLRAYLEKGGFLMFDDFASDEFRNFAEQVSKILPGARLAELTPEHPIFHAFFDIDSLDFYHPYRPVHAHFLGVYEDNDPSKRLVLIANYNNDIMESWEFSDTDYIPIELSNIAYKLGVNYVVYAMTH